MNRADPCPRGRRHHEVIEQVIRDDASPLVPQILAPREQPPEQQPGRDAPQPLRSKEVEIAHHAALAAGCSGA
jgi:hypothetical protein